MKRITHQLVYTHLFYCNIIYYYYFIIILLYYIFQSYDTNCLFSGQVPTGFVKRCDEHRVEKIELRNIWLEV